MSFTSRYSPAISAGASQFLEGPTMKYVIITPAHNEEEFIRFTLDSVVAQTDKPEQWIIVDDGSTDHTLKIIQEYAERYQWIRQVTLPIEGSRELGGRVVRVF